MSNIVYQSVGYISYDTFTDGGMQEHLFMSTAVSGGTGYNQVLTHVMLERDPNNNDLLQKQESMKPLPGNCASRVLAS